MQHEQECSSSSPRQRALPGGRSKALSWTRGKQDSLVSLAPSPLLPPLPLPSCFLSSVSFLLSPHPLIFLPLSLPPPLPLSILHPFVFSPSSLPSFSFLSPSPLLPCFSSILSYLSLLTSSLLSSPLPSPFLPSFFLTPFLSSFLLSCRQRLLFVPSHPDLK